MSKNAKRMKSKGSRVSADLVEAFEELAAYLRGEIEVEKLRGSREPACALAS
jgi:hypothetical protein